MAVLCGVEAALLHEALDRLPRIVNVDAVGEDVDSGMEPLPASSVRSGESDASSFSSMLNNSAASRSCDVIGTTVTCPTSPSKGNRAGSCDIFVFAYQAIIGKSIVYQFG